MSFFPVAGGFLLGPVIGALASRVVTDKAKPTAFSNWLLIGAGVHAAVAVGAYALEDVSHEENLRSFAYGATWGNGIAAGLLGASGLYATTDAGKLALQKYDTRPAPQITSGAGYGSPPAPKGLLGLLVAARAQGY